VKDQPLIETCELNLKAYRQNAEMLRIANLAVHKAQGKSRLLGVPNVYSINGFIYYELPNGELTRDDPWHGKNTPPE
jgi:hypothetical protein